LERLKVVVRIRPETSHTTPFTEDDERRAWCIERAGPSCVRVSRDGKVTAGALYDAVFDGLERGTQVGGAVQAEFSFTQP
jgi:hypothetical protein